MLLTPTAHFCIPNCLKKKKKATTKKDFKNKSSLRKIAFSPFMNFYTRIPTQPPFFY